MDTRPIPRRPKRARQRVRAGPNAWPTAVGAAALFLLAAHERLVWPQILGCVLVAMVASSLVDVVRPIAFDVVVEAPERVFVGAPFELAVRLRNASAARRSVVVRCRWRSRPVIVPELVAFVDVAPRAGESRVRRRVTTKARGACDVVDVEVEVAGAFGFFSRVARFSRTTRLLSLPAPAAALPVSRGPGDHLGAVAARQPDVDVRGVRDWRPGDRISQVHWRSVARTGRMTVLEREAKTAGPVVVVVVAPATRRGRPAKDAVFESALSVATATADAALRRGVGACVLAGSPARVAHPADEAELLELVARLGVSNFPDDEPLRHALAHAAGDGMLLLAAAASAPAAARRHLIEAAAAEGATAIDLAVPDAGAPARADGWSA